MLLQKFISDELKLKNVFVSQVIYDKTQNHLELQLKCPTSMDLSDSFINDFTQKISSFINIDGLKYTMNFKHSLIDEAQIKILLREHFKQHNPSVLTLTNFNDLILECNNGEYFVSMGLDSSILAVADKETMQMELSNMLQNEFHVNFIVNIQNKESNLSLNTILKQNDHFNEELALLRETTKPKFETYEFFQSNAFIGEIVEKEAIRIDCLKNFEGEVILAGTVVNANKVVYTPKNTKEGEEPTEKVRLTFTLQDYWGEISCAYFPNQKTIDLLDDVVDGMTVAIKGEKNEFNGRVNFKVKAVCGIVLPEKPEEEEMSRQPFDSYLVCKPFPYEEASQINLLDSKEELEVSPYLAQNDFVVYDFETTGLSPENCQVIEIGAVKIHNGKITEIFSTLIKSNEPLPEKIVEITNITDEMLKDAPCFELAFADFYKFCQGSTLAGYNNIEFDTKFLKSAWKKIGYKFDFQEEDVFVMAKQKLKLHNYKLGTVVKALEIELLNAHRAYADATATAKAFLKLID